MIRAAGLAARRLQPCVQIFLLGANLGECLVEGLGGGEAGQVFTVLLPLDAGVCRSITLREH